MTPGWQGEGGSASWPSLPETPSGDPNVDLSHTSLSAIPSCLKSDNSTFNILDQNVECCA